MTELRRSRKAHPGTSGPTRKRTVCRKCGYDEVYPARVRWFDLPLLPLLRPCRCNKCYRRSYAPAWKR